MEKHPLHLKNPELQKSEEVERAVIKHERLTEETLPNDPTDRIEAYMNRLEHIFLNPDERARNRNIEMLRDQIYDALIIKKEDFPESYFELQQRVARERGEPVEEIPDNVREQMMETAIEDQRHSLDAWIDYLSSDDAVYPPWFKYYAWTQITKLSQFDKERGVFKKRTKSTVAPYPDIYREPLAKIADLYERVKDDNKDSEARSEFDKKFPTLYAELIQESLSATMEGREEIAGQWIKYTQGEQGGAEKLFQSLDGKGTGWCTAGRTTAETQIQSGDFYVYYTNDSSGEPTQPRLAIRMNGQTRIGEVRGILPHQNIEPVMQGVLDEKLREFGPEADAYHKKSEDMKMLTTLERKYENGEEFTRDDLRFLYEVDSTIQGFGYQRDPRIDEIREKRNRAEDIVTMCDCDPAHITYAFTELNENTLVYCEDTGTKITFFDFREEKNAQKLPQLIELAKQFKEAGTPATPDLSFEGGIVSIDIDTEKFTDIESAFKAYNEADGGSPSWIWDEWRKIHSYKAPETAQLDVIILSYNNDPRTRKSSDAIVADMARANLRPATIAELIALDIEKPEFNKREGAYLIGLGTKEILVGYLVVPLLYFDVGERYLFGDGWSFEWLVRGRFVCVRKT